MGGDLAERSFGLYLLYVRCNYAQEKIISVTRRKRAEGRHVNDRHTYTLLDRVEGHEHGARQRTRPYLRVAVQLRHSRSLGYFEFACFEQKEKSISGTSIQTGIVGPALIRFDISGALAKPLGFGDLGPFSRSNFVHNAVEVFY